MYTNCSCIDELLNNISSFDHSIFSQYIAHYPDSDAIKESDAFFYPLCVLRQTHVLSIYTKLSELWVGQR